MKNYFLGLMAAIFLMGGCKGMAKEIPLDDLTGIWGMSDTKKMAAFLGLETEPKGPYCLDFKPKEGKVFVQFLYATKSLEISVERVGVNRFKVVRDGKAREFMVRGDYSPELKENIYYWNFFDSSPHDPKTGVRDGTKEDFQTLEECLHEDQKQYERAVKAGGGPFPGAPSFESMRKGQPKKE